MKHASDEEPRTRTDQIRQILVETVENEPMARRRRRWKAVRWISPFALVAIGVTTVAGASLLGSGGDEYSIIHCLESVARGPDGKYADAQAMLDEQRMGSPTVDDALDVCREMWTQGALPFGGDPLDPTPEYHEPPAELTACVLADGDIAVVPGAPEACRVLGPAPFG